MSHRRYGSAAQSVTVFNSLHANRGLETFKAALEVSPDVLQYLKALNRTDSRDDFNFMRRSQSPDLRGAVPASHSGHFYGIHTRFPSRPDTAPGLSVSNPTPQHIPTLRFQSRNEKFTDMSPGPETYFVKDTSKPLLCVLNREQKFKERQESYSSLLGPGSYDVKGGKGHPGWEFPKSGNQVKEVDMTPGPGHYPQRSASTSVSFSIPRSEEPLFSESKKMGPGYYGTPDPYKPSKVVKFNSSPRFHESHQQRVISNSQSDYRPQHKRLSSEEKAAQKQRLESNKDLSRVTPEARLQRISELSQKQTLQREVAKIVKFNLQSSVTQRRKTALEDKFRRYEMRMNKDALKLAQRKWVAVVTYVGSLNVLFVKFGNRKALHIRSQAQLKFLMLLSLTLGVILRKRLFIRKRRALVVLKRISPFVARWLLHHKQSMREGITSFIERTMMQDVIYQLMRRWVRNLLLVQRAVRLFLGERKLLYAVLKQTWNLTEAEIHKNLLKSRGSNAELAFEGLSSIPEVIKDYYLRAGLQRKFINYYKEVIKYKEECERIRCKAEENRIETAARAIMLGVTPEEVEVKMPQPPVCSVFLTRNDIKALILDAETNRLHWDKIMQKNRHSRSSRSTAISSKTSL